MRGPRTAGSRAGEATGVGPLPMVMKEKLRPPCQIYAFDELAYGHHTFHIALVRAGGLILMRMRTYLEG